MEYFQSSRGARKGLADTALRTADSGYLTRRLVDVSQDVIVRSDDCGTHEGIMVYDITDSGRVIESLAERLTGRYLADDLVDPKTGEVLATREKMIDEKTAQKIVDAGITQVKIRSILNCQAKKRCLRQVLRREPGQRSSRSASARRSASSRRSRSVSQVPS